MVLPPVCSWKTGGVLRLGQCGAPGDESADDTVSLLWASASSLAMAIVWRSLDLAGGSGTWTCFLVTAISWSRER
jgi:hypothetical protein